METHGPGMTALVRRLRLPVVLAAALAVTLTPVERAAAAPPGAAALTASAPDRGVDGWQVAALGDGRYEVAWTSPRALPTGSDRPTISGEGLRFGPSTTARDGRTVRALVTADRPPDPAALDVVLSGDRLDERGLDPAVQRGAGVGEAPRTAPLPATDPGLPGPYGTVSSAYRLPGVKVPGLPEPVEMVGHVVEPSAGAATGPRPLVLFLHGRHEVCYDPDDPDAFSGRWPCRGRFEEIPSHLGYVYVQRLLASQGYATVSVRVNGINAQDFRLADGGADARARIVAAHLDHWTTLAAAHQVDLDRVVLVGHSRGGEGVDRASIQVPLSAPYRIAGQVLIAPTDFASHTAPYVPTATLLPYCDGDVYDIQGQKFTDTARDLAADDTALKSSVLVMGANHNFFNTEWTPGVAAAPAGDDWFGDPDAPCGRRHPGRLSAAEQRAVGRAYVAGAVHVFADGDGGDYLPLFDGSPVTVGSIGDADVRSHAIGGGRDLRRPGIEATPTRPTRATTRLCVGVASSESDDFGRCGRRVGTVITPHWSFPGEGQPTRRFLEMSWNRPGAVGGLRFDDPLDLTGDRLELRTIVDSRRGPVDLRVRLRDGSGGSAVVVPEGGTTLAPPLTARSLTKWWAQPLLVDATGAAGVDLADVRSVELLGDSARGRVWVADLAAAPAALAPVPASRLPQVSLGDLRVAEGDPSGGDQQRRLARVPFTIAGEVTRPAQMVVVTTGESRGARHRYTVDVAPGQTRGTIPVEYVADRVASRTARIGLAVWALRGLATDDYLGSLRVTDDDPRPTIRIRSPRQVREGRPVVVRVELSVAAGYDVPVYAVPVKGPGEDLRGTDVPRAWLDGFTDGDVDRTLPLHRLGAYADGTIRAGGQTTRLVFPTLRDGRREGRERLTLQIYVDRRQVTRSITVLDR